MCLIPVLALQQMLLFKRITARSVLWTLVCRKSGLQWAKRSKARMHHRWPKLKPTPSLQRNRRANRLQCVATTSCKSQIMLNNNLLPQHRWQRLWQHQAKTLQQNLPRWRLSFKPLKSDCLIRKFIKYKIHNHLSNQLLTTLLALLVGFPVLTFPVALGFWVTTLLNPLELLCTDWY